MFLEFSAERIAKANLITYQADLASAVIDLHSSIELNLIPVYPRRKFSFLGMDSHWIRWRRSLFGRFAVGCLLRLFWCEGLMQRRAIIACLFIVVKANYEARLQLKNSVVS